MAVFNIEGYNSYSGCDIIVTASLPLINGQSVGKYYTLGSIQTLSISTHQDKRPVRSLGVINAKDYVMGPRTIAGSMVFAVFNKHFATEIMNDLGATGTDVILPDEIPALDITVSFANEYGRKSRMAIYGVKLINEGQVMSINDLYTENTYQFVALGLEPLSAEDPNNPSTEESISPNKKGSANYYAVTPSTQGSEPIDTKEYNDNSGIKVSNQIKNNTALNESDLPNDDAMLNISAMVELTVETSPALSEDDFGLAVFSLSPTQSDGHIYIYEGKIKKQTPDYTLVVTNRTLQSMSLSIGDYTAQYIGPTSNYSNTVNFTIDVMAIQIKVSNNDNYPVIEKVTHDSIVVSNNDNKFNVVNLFETGGDLQSFQIGRTPLTITNLKSDTEYNIFTSNELSANRSDVVTVKTFEYENEELKMLNDYIANNQNLLLSNVETLQEQLSLINMNDYNTLIDAVLTLPESVEKQEALIYATRLTNQLIDSYNAVVDNHIPALEQENPFDNKIGVDLYNRASFYNCNNKKNTLNKVIDTAKDEFYATANRHYCVYGLDENNNKSIKKDFLVLRNNYLYDLEHYTETNKYKNLDLSYYNSKYQTYSNDVVLSMAIADNCYCDLDLLEPPYIYQNEMGRVIADIKYDHISMRETFYLVCSNIYDALDYKPFRKIPFDFESETLELNDYYLGLLKGEKYLFWIESEDCRKISKPYLFVYHSMYDEKDDFDKIQKEKLYSKTLSTKSELEYSYGEDGLLNDLFNYIYDYEPAEKNFNNLSITELINYYESSIYGGDTFNALYELIKVTHNNNQIKILPNIVVDKAGKCIKIDVLNGYYVCALNYTAESTTRLYDADGVVYYGDEGYTMVYLLSNSMMYKSGFVLIDCTTNNYKYTDDLCNHVKEGEI